MFFISKKIMGYIYCIACCSGIYVTKAMEQEEPTPKRIKMEEQVTAGIEKKIKEDGRTFESLPEELKAYIISFLWSAENKEKAVKNIKALSLASKELYTIVNDPNVLGDLIVKISNRYGKHPIEVALEFKNLGVLDWLKSYIQQHPEEQKALDMFLLETVRKNNRSHLIHALKVGANVDAHNKLGATPLLSAISKNNKEFVKLLLKAGAHANYVNTICYSGAPLPYAICIHLNDKREIIELLLEYGADVNAENALQLAVSVHRKDIIELLIQYGANVNQADSSGQTPLSWARMYGATAIVELLCEHGAV
jgi:ankyrin repeat protein